METSRIKGTLGFIGTGTITDAMVRALSRQIDPPTMIVSRRSSKISVALATEFPHVIVAETNQEIVDSCEWIILAVRPQVAQDVVTPLTFRSGQKVVSVIAALSTQKIATWINVPVSITQGLPLPFIRDGAGATVLYPPNEEFSKILGSVVDVIQTKDPKQFQLFFLASALMGIYFGLLDVASQWLQDRGLKDEDARLYLTQLFAGLSRTTISGERSFDELRQEFSTLGGLNEQLFNVFKENSGDKALQLAMSAVLNRIQES